MITIKNLYRVYNYINLNVSKWRPTFITGLSRLCGSGEAVAGESSGQSCAAKTRTSANVIRCFAHVLRKKMKMESAGKRFNATLLRQNCNKSRCCQNVDEYSQTSSTASDGTLWGGNADRINRMYGWQSRRTPWHDVTRLDSLTGQDMRGIPRRNETHMDDTNDLCWTIVYWFAHTVQLIACLQNKEVMHTSQLHAFLFCKWFIRNPMHRPILQCTAQYFIYSRLDIDY